MKKDEMNIVYKYLDISGTEEIIDKIYLLLFSFEAICCFMYGDKIDFKISVPCAGVIFVSMFIWRQETKEDGKLLFLHSALGCSLVSLCFMLIVLGVSHLELLHGCIAFLAMLLFSIPTNIYLAKRKARKILNGDSDQVNAKMPSYYNIFGLLGMVLGTIAVKLLNYDTQMLLLMIGFGFVAFIFQGCAIRDFHREILRRRYHIDEWLEQQKSNVGKKGVKQ